MWNPNGGEILSGTRADFQMNGVVWGTALEVSIARNVGHAPIAPMGQATLQSHELLSLDFSLSVGMFATVDNAAQALGWPGGAWLNGESEVEWLRRAVLENTHQAIVYDKVVDKALAICEGVRFSGESISFASREVSARGISLVCTRVRFYGPGALDETA